VASLNIGLTIPFREIGAYEAEDNSGSQGAGEDLVYPSYYTDEEEYQKSEHSSFASHRAAQEKTG